MRYEDMVTVGTAEMATRLCKAYEGTLRLSATELDELERAMARVKAFHRKRWSIEGEWDRRRDGNPLLAFEALMEDCYPRVARRPFNRAGSKLPAAAKGRKDTGSHVIYAFAEETGSFKGPSAALRALAEWWTAKGPVADFNIGGGSGEP